MKLYGYYRSSASYRIRMILNVKGVAWENVPVMLNEGEQLGDEFRRINPMGFVPVLDAGESVLAQSAAIAEYLEETLPEPPLLPGDAAGRARVREMQNLIGCDIHPVQNLRILKYLRAEFGQDDDGVGTWCRHWIAEGFNAFEKLAADRSADGRFACGDKLTLADVWLLPQHYNAVRFGLNLAPYPTIASIVAHVETIPAIAAAHPSQQPDAPENS